MGTVLASGRYQFPVDNFLCCGATRHIPLRKWNLPRAAHSRGINLAQSQHNLSQVHVSIVVFYPPPPALHNGFILHQADCIACLCQAGSGLPLRGIQTLYVVLNLGRCLRISCSSRRAANCCTISALGV